MKIIKTLVYVVLGLIVVYGILSITSSLSKPETKFSLTQSAVITRMQALSRLETASFTIEKIIEGGVQGNVFQNILYGDKILLIAHADVVAGFDLSKITTQDVLVSGKELVIHLPAPEILYSRLDNAQTKVYDRKLGLLTKGDSDLESQARAKAEETIRKAACDGGILRMATDNAQKQFQGMFGTAGFEKVVVTAKTGECK